MEKDRDKIIGYQAIRLAKKHRVPIYVISRPDPVSTQRALKIVRESPGLVYVKNEDLPKE